MLLYIISRLAITSILISIVVLAFIKFKSSVLLNVRPSSRTTLVRSVGSSGLVKPSSRLVRALSGPIAKPRAVGRTYVRSVTISKIRMRIITKLK
jgi:hypothetical protein